MVHKRFIDQVTAYVRLHFPRRLKEDIAAHLQRAILGGEGEEGAAGAASASGKKRGGGLGAGLERLVTLMAEPPAQGQERAALTQNIAALSKAQRELRRGGLAALAAASVGGSGADKKEGE